MRLLIGTATVVFLANASLLVLQLAAGRYLAPFIGSSVETWTSVIGVFLTGIALGNWIGGRVADRFPSPRTVCVLLILGGLSSLGMIACYEYTLSSGFYRSLALGPRIPALAFFFCIPPAFFLSLLTPVTIKLLLPDVGSAGRIAGLVFAISTLGCLIGNYLTGFWLMAFLTLNEMTIGVGCGLIALAL
ncbi:MAG: fused MFS/spermidine synthase, partial [Planctomycetes bacterium]|nr:fused MFS/spermidine synthase [Planctomycetota bacterium]